MGVTTWKQIVEHNEMSKLFFGSINGFSPALRIVSCRLWVGFRWLMATGVRSMCTFLIFVVVDVRDIGIVSALKLAFRGIEKLLLTWWFIGPISRSVIIKDVSCGIRFYPLFTKSRLCSFIIFRRRGIINLNVICNELELGREIY
jgi:hypothetical protein